MRPFITLLISDPTYRKLGFRAAFLLYAAVIVFGSIPGARAEVGELASGLTLHLSTYSIIALLLFYGCNGAASSKAGKSFLIIGAMGAIDELVQSFFPYRGASWVDWFVDMNAGFFTVTTLWAIWPKGESGKTSEPVS